MKVKELKDKLDEFDDDLEVVFHLIDEEEHGKTGTQYPYCVADYMQKQLVKGGRDEDGKIDFDTIYLHEADETSREVLFVSLTSEF